MTDSYSKLLSWHAAHIRSLGHIEFGATILRTRSKAMHDVLAYVATDDKYTVAQLKKHIYEGTFHQLKFRNLWLAALGRVVTIQALEEEEPETRAEELDFGMACLKQANNHLARVQENQQFHRLEIEVLVTQSLIDEARELLDANEFLSSFFYGYLRSDLDNPVISRDQNTYTRWLSGFNRPFTENDLLPILPSSSREPRFNDLYAEPPVIQRGGPKVSVLMTSFKPDRADFFTAVKSILNQSWENLELIFVDDASPSEFDAVLAEAEHLDPRVRLIKLEENGGTYRARNAGIEAARGDFITGQDSDDWSHPERIAAQVGYLIENPTVPGVIVEAIRADNALVRSFPGRIPHGPCEVSFMLRTGLGREVGGYLSARKGADGEFRRRVERFTGRKVEAIEKPLYVIRIGHESLSRADFKPGWAHPVRRAFWNASRHWHENTPASQLSLPGGDAQPIPVPDRFKITPPARAPEYDVVYVGDWRAYTSTQRAMIDEIVALRGGGKTVGILHLESIMSPSKETSRFCYRIQAMINAGEVDMVIPDERARTQTAVLYDPTILQFASSNGINLTANLTIIRADVPPPAVGAPDTMYLPDTCDENARWLFTSDVVWTSNDPVITELLLEYAGQIAVDSDHRHIAFHARHWHNTRRGLAGASPIIGRHSANYESLWPAELDVTQIIWPSDGSGEVRILGDARSYLRRYEVVDFPLDWVIYRDREIRPEAFMSGLDFFIYFPDEDYPQGYCREAVEAAAAGAVVILPKRFVRAHGSTAHYAAAEEVPEIISRYVSNAPSFQERTQSVTSLLLKSETERRFLQDLQSLETQYTTSEPEDIASNA